MVAASQPGLPLAYHVPQPESRARHSSHLNAAAQSQHFVRWASEQQDSLYLCDALIFLVSMCILEQRAEERRRNELLHRDL